MSEEAAPTRIGDYDIEGELGEGGMAKVYRAKHAFLETVHAVKVLDPSFRVNADARKRFLDEAKIQAKHLDHENIVKVTNIVATPEHAALVMELIEGPSLESKLGELKTQPAEVTRIMLGVLDAVGYAHAAGIIHRDLKPANVLLQKKGSVLIPKVTDFGIAKVTSADPAGKGGVKKSTHGGARMGTLSYSSPEQIRRAKDVTPRSDIFSLGAMLYELATGEMAFGGESDYDVMENIVNGRFVPPAQRYDKIDPRIASVITKALSPNPADRFASCAEMAAALKGEVALPPSPADAVAPSAAKIVAEERASARLAAVAPPPERSKVPLVIVLLVAAAGLGVGAFLLASKSDPAPPKPPPPPPPPERSPKLVVPTTTEVAPDAAVITPKQDPWAGSGAAKWDLNRDAFPTDADRPPADAESSGELRFVRLYRGKDTSDRPTREDSVRVNYRMWDLASRKLVAKTLGNDPDMFVLTMTQPGFIQAVTAMSAGDTTRFWVPGSLLKSAKGSGDTLVEIELVSIVRAPCMGRWQTLEGLELVIKGNGASCATYTFLDDSGPTTSMCSGDLRCNGATGTFSCKHTVLPIKLAGEMAWSCEDTTLNLDVTIRGATRRWQLSKR